MARDTGEGAARPGDWAGALGADATSADTLSAPAVRERQQSALSLASKGLGVHMRTVSRLPGRQLGGRSRSSVRGGRIEVRLDADQHVRDAWWGQHTTDSDKEKKRPR